MKYYKLLLSLLCIGLANFTYAQHSHTYTLGEPYKRHKKNHAGSLRVADLRVQKEIVGYLKTGALNRHTPLRPQVPFDEMLVSYYDSIEKNNPLADELLLVLYHWEINDNAEAGEIGGLYFDGDFFRGTSNEYKYLGSVDSIYEIKSNWDITEKLITLAGVQTSKILTNFAVSEPITAEIYTIDEAKNRRKKERSIYPIYTTPSFKKGIYYTIEQFLNNEPVDTPFVRKTLTVNGERKQYPAYYLNEKGKKGKYVNPDSYFAIYDGKAWSASTHGMNVPMNYIEGEFVTENIMQGLVNAAPNAMAVGAVLAGIPGALIAGAIAEETNRKTNDSGIGTGLYKVKIDPASKGYKRMRRIE